MAGPRHGGHARSRWDDDTPSPSRTGRADAPLVVARRTQSDSPAERFVGLRLALPRPGSVGQSATAWLDWPLHAQLPARLRHCRWNNQLVASDEMVVLNRPAGIGTSSKPNSAARPLATSSRSTWRTLVVGGVRSGGAGLRMKDAPAAKRAQLTPGDRRWAYRSTSRSATVSATATGQPVTCTYTVRPAYSRRTPPQPSLPATHVGPNV